MQLVKLSFAVINKLLTDRVGDELSPLEEALCHQCIHQVKLEIQRNTSNTNPRDWIFKLKILGTHITPYLSTAEEVKDLYCLKTYIAIF